MKKELDTILIEAQAIRILQVQLANAIQQEGWEKYILKADESWKKLNQAHKAASVKVERKSRFLWG